MMGSFFKMNGSRSADNDDEVNAKRGPRHVAIIMDGNGRWAKQRSLPRYAGHRSGVEAVRKVVSACAKHEVEVLTLFAFSSENWKRPQKEVGLLMELFFTALKQEVKKLHRNNVRLHIIGGREAFSDKLQLRIREAEELTKDNEGLRLVIAANYGGRWDVVNAAKQIATQVKEGQLAIEDVDQKLFAEYLSLAAFPEPDLFIRTGGEMRISNFLLWHLAYTELYFTEKLWPDFDQNEFATAIESFKQRQRRFGLTGDQVEQVKGA